MELESPVRYFGSSIHRHSQSQIKKTEGSIHRSSKQASIHHKSQRKNKQANLLHPPGAGAGGLDGGAVEGAAVAGWSLEDGGEEEGAAVTAASP